MPFLIKEYVAVCDNCSRRPKIEVVSSPDGTVVGKYCMKDGMKELRDRNRAENVGTETEAAAGEAGF